MRVLERKAPTSVRPTWGEGLEIALVGLLVLYSASVVWHLLDSADPFGRELAFVDGAGAVVVVLVGLLLRTLPPRSRIVLSAVLSVAAGANAIGHVAVTGDLGESALLVVVVVVVVAGGLTSTRLAVLVVLLLLLGWFGATWSLRAGDEYLDEVMLLAIGTLAGGMLHLARRRTLLRLLDAQHHLATLSERDELTGLVNRRGFIAALARASQDVAAAGGRLSVVYCDVDGLKSINDAHGHVAGDSVLQQAAARLTEAFPDVACVARLGGDEFGVVVVGADDVEDLRLRASGISDPGLGWGLSVGAASSDETRVPAQAGPVLQPAPDAVAELLRRADERMYAVKRARTRS